MTWRLYLGLALGGLPIGALYALQALGTVLVYRTTRVFSFAQAGLGMVAAFTAASLSRDHGWPTWIAVLLGVAVAVAVSVVMERFTVRPTKGAVQKTVVTLGWLLGLQGLGGVIFGVTGTAAQPASPQHEVWSIRSIAWRFTSLDLLALVTVVVIAVALGLFLSRTAFGTAMRGVADDPEAARLVGLRAGTIASVSWGLGGALAGIAGVLAAAETNLDQVSLLVLTVEGLAAALVGRLESLPLTLAGGFGLGVLQPVVDQAVDGRRQAGVPELFALVVVLVALALRRRRGRADQGGAGLPPAPLGALPTGRTAIGMAAGVLIVAVVAPLLKSTITWADDVASTAIWSTAVLSLVLLAGVVGQVSICAGTFMGVGAFGAGIAFGAGLPFLLALLVGAALAGVAAVLVGLPAIRLEPLELAIATVSVAFTADQFLFKWTPFVGPSRSRDLRPPGFANGDPAPSGHGLAGHRGYAWLCIVLFVLCALGVANLRRGRSGAALTALRSSGAATSAMGFSVPATKLKGFAAAGFVAGVAGVLLAGLFGQASATGQVGSPFDTTHSITLIAYAVIAGLGSVPGTVVGGLLVTVPAALTASSSGLASQDSAYWIQAFSGAVLVLIVVLSPEGLAGLAARARQLGQRGPDVAVAPAVG
ncbi:MAG TPA: ABC transporter permease [Mycobacteriales bacterium]|nr:ABC transporter permease [Mycobacteriales bacterium]